jgi:hypothetical protein
MPGYYNLKRRFCAYTKKQSSKGLDEGRGVRGLHPAVAMGYRKFELTPCTGRVFMDRW